MRKIRWQMMILVILISLAYFQLAKPIQKQSVTISPSPTPAVLGTAIGTRTKTSNCVVDGPLPDKECSPGAIFPEVTKEQICQHGYTQIVRNVPQSLKNDVYIEYNIYSRKTGQYEVDHIIPLELGGSNDIANLYPEAAEPRPGFHEKDALENELNKRVCDGELDLKEAQFMIATDWVGAYQKYLGN